jgi:hypothetical protein
MLGLAHGDNRVFPATTLFNENWLLRVVLGWFSEHRDVQHHLTFMQGARWFSEAWLPSAFLRTRIREGWTRVDGAIGHFSIGHCGKADLRLCDNAAQLLIVEGKMYSPLSSSVKNAPYYDQAARTVACIAESLRLAARHPDQMNGIGFYVLAPQEQIDGNVFTEELNVHSLEGKVRRRVGQCQGGDTGQRWLNDWFLPLMQKIDIVPMAWQSVISAIRASDPETGNAIGQFYEYCETFNG